MLLSTNHCGGDGSLLSPQPPTSARTAVAPNHSRLLRIVLGLVAVIAAAVLVVMLLVFNPADQPWGAASVTATPSSSRASTHRTGTVRDAVGGGTSFRFGGAPRRAQGTSKHKAETGEEGALFWMTPDGAALVVVRKGTAVASSSSSSSSGAGVDNSDPSPPPPPHSPPASPVGLGLPRQYLQWVEASMAPPSGGTEMTTTTATATTTSTSTTAGDSDSTHPSPPAPSSAPSSPRSVPLAEVRAADVGVISIYHDHIAPPPPSRAVPPRATATGSSSGSRGRSSSPSGGSGPLRVAVLLVGHARVYDRTAAALVAHVLAPNHALLVMGTYPRRGFHWDPLLGPAALAPPNPPLDLRDVKARYGRHLAAMYIFNRTAIDERYVASPPPPLAPPAATVENSTTTTTNTSNTSSAFPPLQRRVQQEVPFRARVCDRDSAHVLRQWLVQHRTWALADGLARQHSWTDRRGEEWGGGGDALGGGDKVYNSSHTTTPSTQSGADCVDAARHWLHPLGLWERVRAHWPPSWWGRQGELSTERDAAAATPPTSSSVSAGGGRSLTGAAVVVSEEVWHAAHRIRFTVRGSRLGLLARRPLWGSYDLIMQARPDNYFPFPVVLSAATVAATPTTTPTPTPRMTLVTVTGGPCHGARFSATFDAQRQILVSPFHTVDWQDMPADHVYIGTARSMGMLMGIHPWAMARLDAQDPPPLPPPPTDGPHKSSANRGDGRGRGGLSTTVTSAPPLRSAASAPTTAGRNDTASPSFFRSIGTHGNRATTLRRCTPDRARLHNKIIFIAHSNERIMAAYAMRATNGTVSISQHGFGLAVLLRDAASLRMLPKKYREGKGAAMRVHGRVLYRATLAEAQRCPPTTPARGHSYNVTPFV